MKIGALLGLFGACFTLCALPRQGEVGLNERVSVRTRTQKVSGLKKEEDSKKPNTSLAVVFAITTSITSLFFRFAVLQNEFLRNH